MADKLKLTLAMLIVAIGIGGFYYLDDQSDLIRFVSLLVAGALAVTVALQSAPGRDAWEFGKASRMELRKVVWPVRRETMQVTFLVFVLVVLVALFLWGVDALLLKAVQAIARPGI